MSEKAARPNFLISSSTFDRDRGGNCIGENGVFTDYLLFPKGEKVMKKMHIGVAAILGTLAQIHSL